MRFSTATRDELWIDGRLVESRLSFGTASLSGREVVASDTSDLVLPSVDVPRAERVRVVVSARRVGDVRIDETLFIAQHGVFRSAAALAAALPSVARRTQSGGYGRRTPIVWKNGSAAILLHEAIGHAGPSTAWPDWLEVTDEPHTIDDCGNAPRITNLLREPPASLRRESFRDVPLRRMSNLVARGTREFELPEQRIEVQLVEGGHYEPLTDTVSLRIVSATDGVDPIAPFDFIAQRNDIARALKGAIGEPLEYPGVICSQEGQELFVGSFAPVMLTVFE